MTTEYIVPNRTTSKKGMYLHVIDCDELLGIAVIGVSFQDAQELMRNGVPFRSWNEKVETLLNENGVS